jgi:hypothetical protein
MRTVANQLDEAGIDYQMPVQPQPPASQAESISLVALLPIFYMLTILHLVLDV